MSKSTQSPSMVSPKSIPVGGVPTLSEIEVQLQRLQASPHFKHSLRCINFLNYVVRKTATGFSDQLKERTIGMEVFNRPPDYDLHADPIVRAVAGDVRKRLVQYYYEPEHRDELRIELHSGSYIPEFKLAAVENSWNSDAAARTGLQPPRAATAIHFPFARLRFRYRMLGAGLLVGALAAVWIVVHGSTAALDHLWKPFLRDPGPRLICVGSVMALVPPPTSAISMASVGGHPLYSNPISISDAIAIATLQQFISSHARASIIQSAAETSFSDLQRTPTVYISGFDNPWTMRITEPLRFHFLRPAVDVFAIQDRTDPAHHTWAVNTLTPFLKVSLDYGIVARFHDPITDQMVVVAAGIGENGTIAASQMLTNGKYFSELSRNARLPRNYQNFEAVIATQVIDGKPGPPRVVASCTW